MHRSLLQQKDSPTRQYCSKSRFGVRPVSYPPYRALGGRIPEGSPWTLNDSQIHIDFMVGTPDLHIVGTTESGEEVVVFDQGDFVL